MVRFGEMPFRMLYRGSVVLKTTILALGLLLLLFTSVGVVPVSHVAAQAQYVIATPGYINLGMNSTIQLTAPKAGTYTVVVKMPNGTTLKLNETLSAGKSQNETFGSATSGFDATTNQVGTYNVFVENSTATLISSTSFYVTDKLLVTMSMVNSGTCIYVQGVDRGVKIFPRFLISYASNGVQVTNSDRGISVNFTLPSGALAKAGWDPFARLFVGGVFPNWNYSNIVTNWSPNATISDAAGNVATFSYTGIPFYISPATLSTSVTVVNSKTNQTLSGLSNGTSLTVLAVISYPTNAEPVSGFVAPLDSVNRGGSVTALIGWGYYNVTTGTFGGGKSIGGDIAQVTMTYTGKSGIWEGNYTASSVPALKPGTAYEIVVNAKDSAPTTPNTGSASATLGSAVVQTTTSPSVLASIPLWAYAGTTVALIVGVIVGFLARKPK
jgi:hypothetical protein